MNSVLTEPRLGAVAVRAAQHYLLEREDILEYLYGRGLSHEDILAWQLGYWEIGCTNVLSVSGFSDQGIDEMGLGSRMHDRVTFPVLDPAGRPVGLIGRAPPKPQIPADHTIKYLYPPNSRHYLSSIHLFGLHQVLESDDLMGKIPLVVEGPIDVILAQRYGHAALSPHKGYFTEHQAALLRSLNRDIVVLCPDRDDAGKNMLKSALKHRRLLPNDVTVVNLPPTKDPADVLSDSPQSFATLVEKALPLR